MSRPPYLDAIDISASGLRAQRIRMNTIAENVANINTTRTDEGGPYRRQIAVLSTKKEFGAFKDYMESAKLDLTTTKSCHLEPVKGEHGKRIMHGVEAHIELDNSPSKMIFDPGHPDADEAGYVSMPNVNIVEEMVNMISASRSYEANVTALNAVKSMARSAMEL